MGFVITDQQRTTLEAGGLGSRSVTSNLANTLRENHARVLDFFRSVDTNFDGVISKGEMSYALFSLGLSASPKEVDQLFRELDPSGDGVLELHELQEVLRNGARAAAKAPPKQLTAAQRERQRMENRAAMCEMREIIYQFERARGLDDPSVPPPPSAEALLDNERLERLQAQARKAREAGAANAVPRGEMMSRMDACCVKSKLVRPQTAPARQSAAAAAAARKAAQYDFWLSKHREEIESHRIAVEKEYAEDRRIRRERVATRRRTQLDTMHQKQQVSRAGALERHEPFPMRREVVSQRRNFLERTHHRALNADIVFLPRMPAARALAEKTWAHDPCRHDADAYEEGKLQVQELS